VEPHIDKLPKIFANKEKVSLVETDIALEQADMVVGLVDNDEFKFMNADVLKGKVVIDVRGMLR